MAETVHLFLKANGADIQGDSSESSLGREGSIECVLYEQSVSTAREAASGMATGRRQYDPLRIRKRIDRSSPLILKALTENQAVQGTFRFFRPSPSGDGSSEQFYTVEIKQGRVASVKQYVADTLDADTVEQPPMEEVTFVFNAIEWTVTDGGISHEDLVGGRR